MLARHAARLNGMWGLALTKLDVLTGIDPLQICVAYDIRWAAATTRCRRADRLEKARPVYEELPGWSEDISGARSLDDLPVNARRYLDGSRSSAG